MTWMYLKNKINRKAFNWFLWWLSGLVGTSGLLYIGGVPYGSDSLLLRWPIMYSAITFIVVILLALFGGKRQ